MEELKKEREQLFKLVKIAKSELFEVRDKYYKMEKEYFLIKEKYETVDRQIAMLRRTILPPTGTGKSAPPPQLTIEQVKSIANKLGIKITVKEEEEC